MTRHVLEALAEAGVPPPHSDNDEAMRNTLVFVRRCRYPDGGFFFSTVKTGAIKAGEDATGYLAYGTTTADGLLCLYATGAPDTAPSLAWLRQLDHPALPRASSPPPASVTPKAFVTATPTPPSAPSAPPVYAAQSPSPPCSKRPNAPTAVGPTPRSSSKKTTPSSPPPSPSPP